MDLSNWRPAQGAIGAGGDITMESGDWRAQLQRERIVNKIMDTLKRHLPFSEIERLQELKKLAERVEEEIYTAATSQSEYSRKICFMMLTMETRLQNPMPSNSATLYNSVNPSAPLDSTAQTSNQNGGNWQDEVYQKLKAMKDLYLLYWQEEAYQKIKAMKDLYLLDLNYMHQKILSKLQQHDSLPQQPKNEPLEKLKAFKNILERFMLFLQIPKHGISANHKDKLGTYEKQIINVINSNRRKPAPPQQQAQALPPQHMQSLQQTHSQLTQVQSHDQMNLQGSMAPMQPNNMGNLQQSTVSLSGGSNAQQNMMNFIQPSSNLGPGQERSMNYLQQIFSGCLQQNTVSGPQQVNLLSTQVQQPQPQLLQQLLPHMQCYSGQLQQQQVDMQQHPHLLQRDIQQRLPTTGGFQQQNVIDQQKQLFQQQKAMPEASSTSLDSTAQTGNPNGGDWQEEVYQKIKAMKDLYLLDLNDMHQKILSKLQQQPNNEQLEKLKVFKNMLERFMQFLQIPKHGILANYKDKLGTYEKQIINVINSYRWKPAPPQQQAQALPPQHMQSSQQAHSQLTQVQSHDQMY